MNPSYRAGDWPTISSPQSSLTASFFFITLDFHFLHQQIHKINHLSQPSSRHKNLNMKKHKSAKPQYVKIATYKIFTIRNQPLFICCGSESWFTIIMENKKQNWRKVIVVFEWWLHLASLRVGESEVANADKESHSDHRS